MSSTAATATVYVVGASTREGAILPGLTMPYAVRMFDSAREALTRVLKPRAHAGRNEDVARMVAAIADAEALAATGGIVGPLDGDCTLWMAAVTVEQLGAIANSPTIDTMPEDPAIGALSVDDAVRAFNRYLESLADIDVRLIVRYFACQARNQAADFRCACTTPGFCALPMQTLDDLAPAQ